MSNALLDVLKEYAQGVGWGVGIMMSIIGAVLAFLRLNNDRKKLKLEEIKLKRIEWKELKRFHKSTESICLKGAVGKITKKDISNFSDVWEDSRMYFSGQVVSFMFDVYSHAKIIAECDKDPIYKALRKKRWLENEDESWPDSLKSVKWFQMVLTDVKESKNRIDLVFSPYMGID